MKIKRHNFLIKIQENEIKIFITWKFHQTCFLCQPDTKSTACEPGSDILVMFLNSRTLYQ